MTHTAWSCTSVNCGHILTSRKPGATPKLTTSQRLSSGAKIARGPPSGPVAVEPVEDHRQKNQPAANHQVPGIPGHARLPGFRHGLVDPPATTIAKKPQIRFPSVSKVGKTAIVRMGRMEAVRGQFPVARQDGLPIRPTRDVGSFRLPGKTDWQSVLQRMWSVVSAKLKGKRRCGKEDGSVPFSFSPFSFPLRGASFRPCSVLRFRRALLLSCHNRQAGRTRWPSFTSIFMSCVSARINSVREPNLIMPNFRPRARISPGRRSQTIRRAIAPEICRTIIRRCGGDWSSRPIQVFSFSVAHCGFRTSRNLPGE